MFGHGIKTGLVVPGGFGTTVIVEFGELHNGAVAARPVPTATDAVAVPPASNW